MQLGCSALAPQLRPQAISRLIQVLCLYQMLPLSCYITSQTQEDTGGTV